MTKKEASHHWHLSIRASVAAPATPITREFQTWIRLQQAFCSFPENFHGALSAGFKVGPDELDSVIRALSVGFDLARGQVAKKPTFRR
jgi:hypothetical protein